jgi:hypothetical protein
MLAIESLAIESYGPRAEKRTKWRLNLAPSRTRLAVEPPKLGAFGSKMAAKIPHSRRVCRFSAATEPIS